jgi:hypothetical protein
MNPSTAGRIRIHSGNHSTAIFCINYKNTHIIILIILLYARSSIRDLKINKYIPETGVRDVDICWLQRTRVLEFWTVLVKKRNELRILSWWSSQLKPLFRKPRENIEVFWNGGTPKSPNFNRIFHYKPTILGYPHWWKPPYVNVGFGPKERNLPKAHWLRPGHMTSQQSWPPWSRAWATLRFTKSMVRASESTSAIGTMGTMG